jgi:2-methylcitrate dehydratase PrpD
MVEGEFNVNRRELAQTMALGIGGMFLEVSRSSAEAQQTPTRPPATKPPESPGLTLEVAEFVAQTRYEQLPAELIDLGKKSMLDSLGLALSGSVADTGRISRAYLDELGLSKHTATVIGSAMKAPARFAAFVNGIGMHADDYDDTQLAVAKTRVYGLLTHPTTPVFSAALAASEADGRSGRDLIEAYHLGVEVETKISEAISPRHYEDGFHSTGTCGVFGSTIAIAKLRHLDTRAISNALGVAGSQSAGLRANFGTMTKPLQAGHAAEVGLMGVDLVQLGWTASPEILESPQGFFHAEGGGYDADSIHQKLGKPWTFISPGVSIKPFPSGSLTHPAMSQMAELIKKQDIKADQVESIRVGTNRNMPNALIHHRPTTGLQAKFSMEYCVAVFFVYRKAGLAEFTDEAVNKPEVQAMLRRVEFVVSPEAEKAGYDKMTTIIDVHLRDGRTISSRADFAKGSPQFPMTFDDVAEKFQDAAAYAKWDKAKSNKIVDSIRHLEDLPDVRSLTALCAT